MNNAIGTHTVTRNAAAKPRAKSGAAKAQITPIESTAATNSRSIPDASADITSTLRATARKKVTTSALAASFEE